MYFTWCWSGPHHTFPSTNTRDIIESKTSISKKNSQLIGSQKWDLVRWPVRSSRWGCGNPIVIVLWGSPNFPIITFQNNHSGPNSLSGSNFWELMVLPKQSLNVLWQYNCEQNIFMEIFEGEILISTQRKLSLRCLCKFMIKCKVMLGHYNLITCLTSSVGRKWAILEFKKKLKNVCVF